MKKILSCLSVLLALQAGAQPLSDFISFADARLIIAPGGRLTINSSLSIPATGKITNNGRLEVKGNFINNGIYTSENSNDSVLFSGSGKSLLKAETGGITIANLLISKTANTDTVEIYGNVTVTDELSYQSGILTTRYDLFPNSAIIAPLAATFSLADGKDIIGKVTRTGWAHSFPTTFNNNNFYISTFTGSNPPSSITCVMLPGTSPSQNEREVNRSFMLEATGGSGFNATVRFPYSAPEVGSNTEANLIPWSLANNEWNAFSTNVSQNTSFKYVTAVAIPSTSFNREWKLADPRYTFYADVFLRGAWNGTDMNASLNAVLPSSQPFTASPFNYNGSESVGSFGTNVVDWVLVELRKPASGAGADATSSTIIGRKAGLLYKSGTILGTDGNFISFDISKQGPAFMVVRHRNHLGVMSNIIPSNAAGTFTNNFSVLANSYKAPDAFSNPVVLLEGTKYGLWAGDVNNSGVINITDINAIKAAIASSFSGYQLTDINLSNSLNITDVNLAKAMLSASGTGSLPAGRQAAGKIKTNIPDPVNE